MSRYEKKLNGKTLAVGWDRPMRTFFAQVQNDWQTLPDADRNAIYDATSRDASRDSYGRAVEEAEDRLNENQTELWLGGNFDEFAQLAPMVDELKRLGYEIPSALQTRLTADQRGDYSNLTGLPEGWGANN